jgi:hypothetical protein
MILYSRIEVDYQGLVKLDDYPNYTFHRKITRKILLFTGYIFIELF